MSNELESDRAMVMNLNRKFWSRWCWLRLDRDRAAKFDKPAVKIMFHVTQIVRFLLERTDGSARLKLGPASFATGMPG
jgi:hypothetical protein